MSINSNNNKQSTNIVKIVGVLVENSLKASSYINAQGVSVDYISGVLTVRVKQVVSGVEEVSEIPINVWTSRLKKDGTPNPSYENMEKVKDTYISLAAAENESVATKVMVTGGNLTENIFYSKDKLFCSPRIQSNFMSSITNINNFTPEATFTTDIVVGSIEDETDKEGIVTGRLKVKGMICQYNGVMDQINFIVENPAAISYIKSAWQIGDTVQVGGRIRYSSTTEKIEVPTRFGDPVFKTVTRSCKEFVITSDSTDALSESDKFTEAEIKAGIAKRNAAIEKAKEAKPKNNTASTQTTTSAAAKYGF